MGWPKVICDLNILRDNVDTLAELLHRRGRQFAAVTKAFCAAEPIVDMLNNSRCDVLADSRLLNFVGMKTDKPRFLLRIAQRWELDQVVEYTDMSFQSERATIALLGEECARRNKRHGVVLALDMGDLREGCYFKNEADIFAAADAIVKQKHLDFLGVGSNLGCFGGVRTTGENMAALCELAQRLRERYCLALPLVSGMSTAAEKMLLDDTMPAGVTHGRFGEAWLVGWDSVEGCAVPGMKNNAFTFEAQLVEQKLKDSKPVGIVGGNAFGQVIERPDLGPMRRGIIACGAQDVDRDTLFPLDERVKIVGGSYDHSILNLNEADDYQIGDILRFRMAYNAMLRSYTSPYVEKEYIPLT